MFPRQRTHCLKVTVMAAMLRKVLVIPGGIAPERAHRLLEQGFALVINRESDMDEAEALADVFRRNDRAAMIAQKGLVSD
jgi:hypothetical protein